MPTYNSEAFVAEAIESILAQTFGDFEFIIADDGSTDKTPDIIRVYAGQDERIQPFFLDHGGNPRTANFGVRMARGKWIARMDNDDVAMPHRLQAQLAWIKSTGVDMCGALAATIGRGHDVFWYPEDHEAIRRELLFRPGMLHPVVMTRAAVFKENPYNETAHLDDYEMWTRLASRCKMGNVQEILIRRRCHDGQLHIVEHEGIKSDLQKYRFRYFYEMYPRTPLRDYLALARVSDRRPLPDLGQLRRAGQWLVELARHPDPLLRKRMARRWTEACERSASLGNECETVFHEYRGQFEIDDEND